MDYTDKFDGIIKLGDHLVLLYDGKSEITDTVVAYISNSLLNNHKFIYITGDTDVKTIQEKLKERELFNSYIDSRQLVFLDQNDAYSKEGKFNPERMKELLKILAIEAQKDGFEGLAISGEISWVLEYDKGFDLINEYEWKINSEVFGVFPVTALCRYNMDKFTDEMIINVIQLHPFLILNNKVYENPFYIPAIAYETNSIPKYQVKTWLENIVKFSSAKSEFNRRLKEKDLKVYEMKNLLEISLDSAENVIMISLDREYKYMYFNKAHSESMKNAYNTKVELGECIFDYMTSEEDIKKIKTNYDIALSGKHHTSLEVYGDIEKNYYETKFYPTYNLEGDVIGLSVFSSNVTEKTNFVNSLTYERNVAQMYLDVAGVMIMVLDTNANIIRINNKGCEILELDEMEIIGKNWFDNFLPKEIVEQVRVVFKNVFDEKEIMAKNYENSIITASGVEKIINWHNTILYDDKNNIIGILSSGEDITELKEKEIELEKMAFTDYLTSLSNRRKFEEKLIELDVAENLPITIVMADINGLKLINDAFGHLSGDELLKSAGELILSKCRNTDMVARIGGDEFAIIMVKTNTASAERIIKEINSEARGIMIQSIPLSISFGFESKTHEADNIYEVLRSAEDLMYRQKLLEIPSMRSGAIETILNTLYEKDVQSEVHSRTVSDLSERLAKAYGMDRQDIAEVKTAGLLHDIGKIIIPLSIINKQGKLTTEEYSTMKNHPEIGFRILNSAQDMRGISNIVLNHHERWDGRGYPRGIKAEKIPLKSRIIAIADAFDAMTSERSYKERISKEEALLELLDNSGTQFDPELVKVFKENFIRITE